MGALADTDRIAGEGSPRRRRIDPTGTGAPQASPDAADEQLERAGRGTRFLPAGRIPPARSILTPASARSTSRRPLPPGRSSRRLAAPAPAEVTWELPADSAPQGLFATRTPARPCSPAGPATEVRPARSPRTAPRSRGLRRLLPGAATLAVLASVWFGAGACRTCTDRRLTVPAGAVKIPGGYRYVARPGDTLWSIASKLAARRQTRGCLSPKLEQQLHGAELVLGDELKLP